MIGSKTGSDIGSDIGTYFTMKLTWAVRPLASRATATCDPR